MKHKILVIDDEQSICLILENFLSVESVAEVKTTGLVFSKIFSRKISDTSIGAAYKTIFIPRRRFCDISIQ